MKEVAQPPIYTFGSLAQPHHMFPSAQPLSCLGTATCQSGGIAQQSGAPLSFDQFPCSSTCPSLIHPTNHAIILQSVAVSSSRTFRRSHEMMSSAAGRVIHRGVQLFRLRVWSWLIDYWWLYRKRSGFLEMISWVRNR